MVSRNLDQGILAIQQQQLQEGQRLLKIALKNDSLTAEERIRALTWLAETDSNPQFKVQQYQQALQIDPTNQDLSQRLGYWSQQAAGSQQQGFNQGLTPSQGMPPVNPQQQGFSQGLTPSQGMSPVNPQQGFSQGLTPSQGMPPVNPQQGFNQGLTPSQGMSPVNPQQGFNQGLTPSQGMPPVNPQQQGFNQGLTPSQGMSPVNPQQGFNQGLTPSQGTQPINPQIPMQQPASYGQTAPLQIQQVQRSVGVLGGPNGRGTGFFVTREGLIATTRYIVGGEEIIAIQLLSGQHLEGQVVRSFPEFDLAFVQVHVQLSHLMSTTQMPTLPPNMNIVAVPHVGDGLRSVIRATRHAVAAHWFPTVINDMPDAGGNPVFDEHNLLIGMLTKNASRTNGYMYGLYIHKIYQCVNIYLQEEQQLVGQKTAYCRACGIISRAPAFGGFFCENCGNTLPYAIEMNRYPQPNLSALYGESGQPPCPNCQSQVGFYNRQCQRCGYEL